MRKCMPVYGHICWHVAEMLSRLSMRVCVDMLLFCLFMYVGACVCMNM